MGVAGSRLIPPCNDADFSIFGASLLIESAPTSLGFDLPFLSRLRASCICSRANLNGSSMLCCSLVSCSTICLSRSTWLAKPLGSEQFDTVHLNITGAVFF